MNTTPDATGRKPVTQLWIALQKMTRLRDTYSRESSPTGRLAAARAMAEVLGEVSALTGEVLAEAERDTAAAA